MRRQVIEAKIAGKPSPLPYTLDDMAKDAVGLLDALGIKKAHIVGVSMGGMIAQLVAADHPEHVLSLTSIMSTSGNPGDTVSGQARGPREDAATRPRRRPGSDHRQRHQGDPGPGRSRLPARREEDPGLGRPLPEALRGSGGHGAAQRSRSLGLFEDRREKLKTVKVPTVVVHGAEDPIMSVEGGKDTAANIPGAELRIIPGMGHDLPIPLVDDDRRRDHRSCIPWNRRQSNAEVSSSALNGR